MDDGESIIIAVVGGILMLQFFFWILGMEGRKRRGLVNMVQSEMLDAPFLGKVLERNPTLLDTFDQQRELIDKCITLGRLDLLREIQGAGVEIKDGKDVRHTPLLALTMFNKDEKIAEYLLDLGVDPNCSTGGKAPLSILSSIGRADLIEVLLKRGAAVDLPGPCGVTPLCIAAAGLQIPKARKKLGPGVAAKMALDTVQCLLAAGADPNHVDEDGRCPLHFAAEKNTSPEVIEALAHAGADPNLRWQKHPQKPTPFMLVSANANIDDDTGIAMMKVLIKHGAERPTHPDFWELYDDLKEDKSEDLLFMDLANMLNEVAPQGVSGTSAFEELCREKLSSRIPSVEVGAVLSRIINKVAFGVEDASLAGDLTARGFKRKEVSEILEQAKVLHKMKLNSSLAQIGKSLFPDVEKLQDYSPAHTELFKEALERQKVDGLDDEGVLGVLRQGGFPESSLDQLEQLSVEERESVLPDLLFHAVADGLDESAQMEENIQRAALLTLFGVCEDAGISVEELYVRFFLRFNLEPSVIRRFWENAQSLTEIREI